MEINIIAAVAENRAIGYKHAAIIFLHIKNYDGGAAKAPPS